MTEREWPGGEVQVRADVRYVVDSLLQDHELDTLELAWRPSGEQPSGPPPGRYSYSGHADIGLYEGGPEVLWVTVRAGDDCLSYSLWTQGCDWRGRLWRLGDEVQEWLSETGVGWGQLRPFELPPS